VGLAATIRAVAEAAGVSITTVSFVLNNRHPQVDAIPKKTRDRVRACAAALGYRRNAAAASLRTGRSQWIGVLISAMEDESNAWIWATFELALLSAVQRTLSERDYFTVVGTRYPNNDAETVDALASSGIGGLILRCPSPQAVERARHLIDDNVPVIAVFPACGEDLYPYSVDMDNVLAGRMVAEKLLSVGKKEPLCVLGYHAQYLREKRFAGFAEVVKRELGFEPPTCDLKTWEVAENVANIMRALHKYKPDCVMCTDAGSSFLTSLAAERLNLDVPGQLSILGFDCYSFRGARQQRLSSVGASWWNAGQVAAESIVDIITNGTKWTEPKLIEPRFVWGHTTPSSLAEGVALPWVI
jgi:DNA-binding LacI/PurR family transcriptional regulator